MKKFLNDPKDFVDEMLEGIYAAHPDVTYTNDDKRCYVTAHPKKGKVGIATGGGSGHLPLFLGYVGDGSTIGEFREAFRRLKESGGFYQRDPGGVQFISASLFKATVKLPANVPNGTHVVRAHLFRDGAFVAENDGVTYTITQSSLVVSVGSQVIRDEPMVQFQRPNTADAPSGPAPSPAAPAPPLPPPLPAEVGGSG